MVVQNNKNQNIHITKKRLQTPNCSGRKTTFNCINYLLQTNNRIYIVLL